MKIRYLVLWPMLSVLLVSCHKDHNNPPAAPIAPVLTTVPVTDITDTTASGGGTFSTEGTEAINFKGIQWDSSSQFPDHWTASGGTGIGNFTANLSGLLPDMLYYVRAFAGSDSSHTWYGNTVQFTTTYNPGKYLVSTLAGTGAAGFNNGDASIATFNSPFGVTVDGSGNIYIADATNMAIRKISPGGTVSTLAILDGKPNDVIADSAGNVYVAESSYKILKITPAGQVSTLAGSGSFGRSDGTGTSASFGAALTISIDPAGNLYVGDASSFRKITPAGVVSTLTTYTTAGPGSIACFAIAADNHFNLYETNGYTIVKVDSTGAESFFAGSGKAGNADGTGSAASFAFLTEIRTDPAGNIYGADISNNTIRMITPAGVVTTLAGTGAKGARDGNSAIATFNGPIGLSPDNAGNIIVADAANFKIRKISPL